MSRMNLSGHVGHVTIFIVESGLWLGLGLDLVSGW